VSLAGNWRAETEGGLRAGHGGRLEGGQRRREGGGRAVHGRRAESHSRSIPAPTKSFTPPKTYDPRAPYYPAIDVIKLSHAPPSSMFVLPLSMTHSTEDLFSSIYIITHVVSFDEKANVNIIHTCSARYESDHYDLSTLDLWKMLGQ